MVIFSDEEVTLTELAEQYTVSLETQRNCN